MEPADSPVVVKGAVYVAVMGASGLHAKARGREVFAVVGLSEKLLLQTEKVVSDAPVWTRKGVVHPDRCVHTQRFGRACTSLALQPVRGGAGVGVGQAGRWL